MVSGTWSLYFDWGNSGSYSQTTITFSGNGTFTTGDGGSGSWNQLDGTITWTFSTAASYAGNVAGNAMTGTMYRTGSWYAVNQSATAITMAKSSAKSYEA